MADNKYENELPANKFINEMNNINYSANFSGSHDFTDAMHLAKSVTKDIGLLFYKNYKYIFDEYEKRRHRCNYLNFWLDMKENEHKKAFGDKHIQEWEYIKKLRKNIEANRFHPNVCNDIRSEHSLIERGNRYELEHFCENRDHLRNLCEQQRGSISAYNEKCLKLADYVNKYYRTFFDKYRCLTGDSTTPDIQYHVTNDCTLYDMSKTFPEYIFDNKQVSEKVNSRNNIILYSEYENFLSCHKNKEELVSSTIITAETSCSCPPTQNILYGVSALLGIISMFFYLYNFTTLGSWLRGRITKNQIARRDIDDKEAYSLTNESSDIMLNNSVGKGYYLAYEAA
ncbi:PIR protein [Plasmodium ovale]|uniref:PIR protein n=1 Tax=Plasmodium ovale TaxID=36330 RepID=A0A1D3JDZ2_PLAOA|nr:PIR protein [Plasmodium ovale]